MQYININGYSIPYPNSFSMKKVPRIVCEMETLDGSIVADVAGWRYDDTTLQWDTLLDADLRNLLLALDASAAFPITFNDIDGERTVNAIYRGRSNVKTPMFHNGVTVWKDIQVELTFPDAHGV